MMAYLNWDAAPVWATHIVGDSEITEIQCWAQKVGDHYYNENEREHQRSSFAMEHDFPDEPGFWSVVSARPDFTQKEVQ